jgi:hypothetical protein
MKVLVTLSVHKWDRDTDDGLFSGELPSTLDLEIECDMEDAFEDVLELSMDAASNQTGFCILSSSISNIKVLP